MREIGKSWRDHARHRCTAGVRFQRPPVLEISSADSANEFGFLDSFDSFGSANVEGDEETSLDLSEALTPDFIPNPPFLRRSKKNESRGGGGGGSSGERGADAATGTWRLSRLFFPPIPQFHFESLTNHD